MTARSALDALRREIKARSGANGMTGLAERMRRAHREEDQRVADHIAAHGVPPPFVPWRPSAEAIVANPALVGSMIYNIAKRTLRYLAEGHVCMDSPAGTPCEQCRLDSEATRLRIQQENEAASAKYQQRINTQGDRNGSY